MENLVFQSFDYNPIGFIRKNQLDIDLSRITNQYIKRKKQNI